MSTVKLYCGDCLEILPTLEAQSVDAVITDPPYPCIKRDYGMLTETDWWDLMMGVCREVRRILKPTGSAVFILQPNSRKVGSMRGWLWEFMAWVCREWNMVQDVWWWNVTAPTCGLCSPRERGLLKASIKVCVWAGPLECYRQQDKVLWSESFWNAQHRSRKRFERVETPSGQGSNKPKHAMVSLERGGTTPYNLLPIPNLHYGNVRGNGHGAHTPLALAEWWTRYICPPGGVVLDPFLGSGTMGLAALKYGNNIIGIEKMPGPGYFETAQRCLNEMQAQMQMALT